MKSALVAVGSMLALAVLLGLWYMGVYNGFVAAQEATNSAWAQVQNDYQRRVDLVPNLVEAVKGAANFEKSTLTAVVDARARATSFTVDKSILNDPAQFKKFEAAQGELGSALSRLMVVVEKYPELKATQNFRDFAVQLEGTENRIAVARRDFNQAAQDYNVRIRRMPGSIVAGISGFKERPYFEAAAGAEKAPAVKF
ncbi:MAG TPA: LemA family protein [Elusimicrobiota bacterium]|nr:LemA family protein [Elusimicrobiota bacterium]